jgi:serine/threonine-protein phosphatase 6 regulatory ankyrin repeat subunit B
MGLGLALGHSRDSLMRLTFRPAQKSSESPASARRLQAARVLLTAHANPNAGDRDGDTPLLTATRSGDAELVGLLIAAGADVNARSKLGISPMLVAAQMGLEEIATALVGAKADLSVRDSEGHTPLELATRSGHGGIVKLLQRAPRG